MPLGSPSIIFSNAFGGVTTNPKFSTLSPEAQAEFQKVASYPPGSAQRQANLANNPALQAAIKEAQGKGLLSNTPLWQEILKGTAITLGGALAGPAIGGLVGGGGAASAGGAADATLASMAPGAEGGLGAVGAAVGGENLAAIGGGAAGAVVPAAAKGSSLLHDLLPSIIGAGAGVGGAAIAAHANTEAAKIAAAQADKALAIQQQQYALQRQDTAPYRALGQGAVNNLGYLGGIDTTSNLAALSSTVPNTPPPPLPTASTPNSAGPTPAPSLSALSQPSGGSTVRIQDPATGLVHLIPQTQAAAAQQAGGRLV